MEITYCWSVNVVDNGTITVAQNALNSENWELVQRFTERVEFVRKLNDDEGHRNFPLLYAVYYAGDRRPSYYVVATQPV